MGLATGMMNYLAQLLSDGRFSVLNNAIDLRRYTCDPAKRQQIRGRYRKPELTTVAGNGGKLTLQKNQGLPARPFSPSRPGGAHVDAHVGGGWPLEG